MRFFQKVKEIENFDSKFDYRMQIPVELRLSKLDSQSTMKLMMNV